jgi:uncharacterized membrane protein (DUF485 family)
MAKVTLDKIFDAIKDRIRRSIDRERSLERSFERFSRLLWPWQEYKLVLFVSLLAVLDYVSTFAALELSGNNQVIEAGLLAGWALRTGGFLKLFLVDTVCIGSLILLAMGARLLYSKIGFLGFGRTAFVFLLIPYSVIIMAVVINNILVTFL